MWRRWRLPAVSVPVLLVLAACADPTTVVVVDDVAANVAPGHHVVGSGHVEQAAGLREFTFHAIQHPNGSASGSYRVVLPGGAFFEADVTCLAVEGSTGWVGGTIRDSNVAAVIIGSTTMFFAIDGGEGGEATDIVSLAAINGAAGLDLAFCANRPLALPQLTVTQGNVQVR